MGQPAVSRPPLVGPGPVAPARRRSPRRPITAAWGLVLLGLSALTIYLAATSASLLPALACAVCLGLGLWLGRRWAAAGRGLLLPSSWTPAARQTHLALMVYALVGASLLVGARQALGLDDPPADWTAGVIPAFAFRDDPGVSVYDKTHVRLALLGWCVFLAALAVILPLWWQYLRVWVHFTPQLQLPAALLVPVALLGTITLPPFWIDLPHWGVWLGPALDIGRGSWPYFHATSGYGLLSAAAVAAWVHVFGISPLSLAALVTLVALVAVTTTYVLVARSVHNGWVALGCTSVFLFGFYELQRSIAAPNVGPLRWELSSSLGLLAVWTSLSRRRSVSVLAGLAFGLVVLWDPPLMGFMAVGFLAVHVYRFATSRRVDRLGPVAAAAASGLAVVVAIVLSSRWPADGLAGIFHRSTQVSAVFLAGFANRNQTLSWIELGCLGVMLLVAYGLWWRGWARRRRLQRVHLFLAASLFAAMPALLVHLGRTDVESRNALVWVLLPAAALLSSTYYRMARMRRRSTWPVLVPALLIIGLLNLPTSVAGRVTDVAVHYEIDRFIWSATCAGRVAAQQPCDESSLPTLRHALAAAAQPPVSADDSVTAALFDACRAGQPILSELDAFVYAQANCSSADRPGSIVNVVVVQDIQQVMASALRSTEVVLDWRPMSLPHWQGFASYAAEQLRQAGFLPVPQSTGGLVQPFVRSSALAGASEMLTDPDFKQVGAGAASDWVLAGNVSFDASDAQSGAGAVHVGPDDSVSQAFVALPGTHYLYSVRVKSGDSATASARLQILWLDDLGRLVGSAVDVVPTTGAYQAAGLLRTPPAEAVSGMLSLVAQTGDVWFADVRVEALRGGRPIAWGPNLISDSSFDGLLAAASASGWTAFMLPAATDNQTGVALSSSTGRPAVFALPESGYVQAVPVEASKVYRLSHTTWTAAGRARARLQVTWLDATGRLLRPSISVVQVGPDPGRHSAAVRAPDGATTAMVYVTPHDGGRVWFADVALEALAPDD